jgi:hypothetical protein
MCTGVCWSCGQDKLGDRDGGHFICFDCHFEMCGGVIAIGDSVVPVAGVVESVSEDGIQADNPGITRQGCEDFLSLIR